MDTIQFKQDIIKGFDTLINTYKLEIIEESDFRILLKGNTYSVGIAYDARDLCTNIYFKDKDNNIYDLWRLLRYLCIWQEWDFFKNKNINNGSELYIVGLFVSSNIKKLIKNGFSWKDSFFNYEKRINEIYKKLFELGENHPIYRKYKENDPSWEADILELLSLK